MRSCATSLSLIACTICTAACSSADFAYLGKTWPEDQPAVLIIAHENGEVVETLLVPPGPIDVRELVSIDGPIVVHARVYRSLSERSSVAECSLHVGGTVGDSLGAPALAWRSAPIELGDGDIVLKADSDPQPYDVRVSGCAQRPAGCDVLLSFVETDPVYTGLKGVAAIYPDTAIAAGGSRSASDPTTMVVRIDGERSDALDVGGVTGLAGAVVRHGLNAVIATGQTITEVDSSGRLVRSTTVAVMITGGSAGEDGTAMFIGIDGSLFEILPGDNLVRPFAPPSYSSLSTDTPRIALNRRDRILLAGPDARLYSWNGVDWRHEIPSTVAFDAVAVDERAMLAVPEEEQMLLRIGDGEWRALGPAFVANNAIAAASIGGGRFLVTGQSGSLVYWNGEQLCRPGSATDRNLEDVDFYPGSQVGFIVGENQDADSPPLIVRVEIPN